MLIYIYIYIYMIDNRVRIGYYGKGSMVWDHPTTPTIVNDPAGRCVGFLMCLANSMGGHMRMELLEFHSFPWV